MIALLGRQGADGMTCAYCGSPAPVSDWPRGGDYVAFCHRTDENAQQPGGTGAYSIRTRCPKCNKVFHVVWDTDPR